MIRNLIEEGTMKLRSYKKLFLEIIANIGEGIHVIDGEGKTIFYNKKMEELEQLTGKEVLNKPFDKIFANVDDSTMLRSLKNKEIIKNEMQTYINKYGKPVTTVNTTIPILEGPDVIAVVEIANNITRIQEMNETIIELRNEKTVPKAAKGVAAKHYTFDAILWKSEAFGKIIKIAQQAKKIDASVFIFGETGTGKELIAQSIHYDGNRSQKPFIAQNCAAIPESLLEGLLFGTTKGGFTGAIDRAGLFEQANGGTLLLDEINSMPYDIQAKLLRVLQEGYIRRVGGSKDIPVDVRIIATSNEGPSDLLKSNRFRSDLFYRLNVISIEIPPLRERKEDILLLAESFIKKYNKIMHKNVWMISEHAKKNLTDYSYPGNVRELENIITRGMTMLEDDEHVLTSANIDIRRNMDNAEAVEPQVDIGQVGIVHYLEEIEMNLIKKYLRDNQGNITKTAEDLKIKRQTLQHKLKKYNLDPM